MRFLLWLVVITGFAVSLAFAGVAGVYAYYARELPDYTKLDQRKVFQTARILDRNGEVLDELTDPQGGNRTVIPLAQMPAALRDATIAAEDANFYSHPGFDPRAVVRALWQAFREREVVSGASTITQQLVKNTLLTPEATAERKVKEALLAIEISRRYSKDKILELYLNEVYYGNLAYGVEAAAQTYFGKPVRELDLAQISFIAGLPQAPSAYDPYTNPQAARERQDYVLEQMERQGFISRAQRDAARSQPIVLRPREQRDITQAPHFVVWVRELLERSYSSDTLYTSGLQVRTTLDLRLQRAAEKAAREQIAEIRARNASNAALVAIQPTTGEILAMVGSADFDDDKIDGQVNVALRPRQPGSTLKPFTYLAAFQKGWAPATMVWDVPTTFGGTYTPLNYDGKFRGPTTVRKALGGSLNIPAVKTLETVGLDTMVSLAHKMGLNGLREASRCGLSITLGCDEVTLLDLVYGYVPFANEGRQVGLPPSPQERRPADARPFDPVAILDIRNSAGHVLWRHQAPPAREVVPPGQAYLITHILSDDEARAETFGPNSTLNLPRPAAAKTGTTDEFRDSWVVGYTPDLVAGVWVGNNDRSPMRDVLSAQGAGKVWRAFMDEALANTPPKPFPRPADVVEVEVCALSGLLPTAECPKRATELFVTATVPTKRDDLHKRVEVCIANGRLATEAVPPAAREAKVFVVFPPPYAEWGPKNGYPAPPTERCEVLPPPSPTAVAPAASPSPAPLASPNPAREPAGPTRNPRATPDATPDTRATPAGRPAATPPEAPRTATPPAGLVQPGNPLGAPTPTSPPAIAPAGAAPTPARSTRPPPATVPPLPTQRATATPRGG